ncbi:MAG: redox-regulated ATPase YchF [Armatimonadetes bacterium]|nr:redox-regulated ATPase YchF [Armatimonadota bacterium]
MKVGIIGLPQTGKTALFHALTRGKAQAGAAAHRDQALTGVIPVPDPRFDFLARLFTPKKVSPAAIEFLDGAARMGGEKKRFDSDFFQGIRSVDALCLVVRLFEDPLAPLPAGGVRPLSDARAVYEELVLGDLALAEARLERIAKGRKSRRAGAADPADAEKALIERVQRALEAEQSIRSLVFDPEESRLLKGFDFLTAKPLIVAANIGEGEIGQQPAALRDLAAYCEAGRIPLIPLCARLEMEIALLDESEEAAYLEAMGLAEPARNILVRTCYSLLGMISFFTVGEDEVKAWTIERGTSALGAAAKIHSDIARGFIRAEVTPYEAVRESGSPDAARHAGRQRLEGKDYIVQDGEIVHIRFKV